MRTYVSLQRLEQALLVKSVREGRAPKSQEEFNGLPSKDPAYFPKYWFHDAWGRDIIYVFPSASDTRAFDVYSRGTNGVDDGGNGDDVVPWEYRGYHSPAKEPLEKTFTLLLLVDGPLILLCLFVLKIWRKKIEI